MLRALMVVSREWRAVLFVFVALLLSGELTRAQVTIGFDAVVYTVLEGDPDPMVLVTLNGTLTPGTQVVVTLSTQDGSAVASGDYTNTIMTLTFSDTATIPMAVVIPINVDSQYEGDEMFSVNLAVDMSNLTTFAGNITVFPDSAQVLIQDNDAVTVGFSQSSYTVVEGETVSVCVSFIMGTLEQNITVTITADASSVATTGDYNGVGGSGMGGSGVGGNVIFGPANSLTDMKCIDITATQDNMSEMTEPLVLVLGSPDERIVFNPSNTTVQIIMATVTIEGYPGVTVLESVGTQQVCVTISPTPMVNIAVYLITSDGSALANLDYTPVNTSVVFSSGMNQQCVDVAISDDDLREANQSFSITVIPVQDNVAVVNDTLTVTILTDPTDVVRATIPTEIMATLR